MPSVLTGANLANRELIYLGVSGDGDSALDRALNTLGEAELCPGPEALARFDAAHR
jgi:hypothetical protein